MLELYHFKNSICSERARMALYEKGINDWVDRHVDLFKGEQFAPAYVKLNPKAQTPTLVHNGEVIRESSIICDYLDEVFPGLSLKPDNSAAVAHMREWIKNSDEQLYEVVASLSFASIFTRVLNDKGPEAKEAHFRGQTDLGRVMRQRSCVEEGFSSEYVVRGVNNLMKITAELEQTFCDGRDWIMGDQFTLAEINYIPFIARIEALAMLDYFFDDYPLTTQWWQRCKDRDSFQQAEVGPAAGKEAERYWECGQAVQQELVALILRIKSNEIYDLSS